MTNDPSCGQNCDFNQRQDLIYQSTSETTSTVTIQALYWGIHCNDWHFITVNSIGSSYPSHYLHFDREITLTGRTSLTSYYVTDSVIKIPRTGPPGNHSAYSFCYVPQQHMDSTSINQGYMSHMCNNVRLWHGSVVLFATDLRNHIRRMQPEDTSMATETICR